jgi:hypothetical protein
VNIISKSGGNDVHGSWFYDIYNQDMAARPEYVTKEEHPPIDRKRTGGSAGGPFKKDKMFWFHRFRQWRCIESGQALGGPGGRRGLRKYMDGSRRRIRRCVPAPESLFPPNPACLSCQEAGIMLRNSGDEFFDPAHWLDLR